MQSIERHDRRAQRRSRGARRGFSLLEFVAVATVFGIIAMAAVATFRLETFGNVGAEVHARRLALDLLQARRRSIATGDNHFLQFQFSRGQASYEVYRRRSGSSAAVDAVRTLPSNIKVLVQPGAPEFTFEGNALATYSITLTAPDRQWLVVVSQVTGSVRVSEL